MSLRNTNKTECGTIDAQSVLLRSNDIRLSKRPFHSQSIFSIVLIALGILFLCSCTTMQAQQLREKGARLDWDKDTDRALQFYLQSIELDPNNAKALRACGRLYYNKQEYAQAEVYLKRATEQDPRYSKAWNNLGWVYWRTNRYEAMRNAFEHAISSRKKSNAWDSLGLAKAYFYLDDLTKAELIFKHHLNSSNNEIKRQSAGHLATIEGLKGNFVTAEKLYNKDPLIGLGFSCATLCKVIWVDSKNFADIGGLIAEDIIVSVNEIPIKNNSDLVGIVKNAKYGDTLSFAIERDHRPVTIDIILDYGYYLPVKQISQTAKQKAAPAPTKKPAAKQPEKKAVPLKPPPVAYTAIPDSKKFKLAVMEFQTFDQTSGSSTLGAMIAEMFTTEIVESDAFKIVEREQLQKVLKEFEVAQSGIIDTTQAQEIGKMLGAAVIVTGAVIKISDQLRIDSRIIEVETGVIVSADRKVCSMDINDISRAVTEMTRGLSEKFYQKNK